MRAWAEGSRLDEELAGGGDSPAWTLVDGRGGSPAQCWPSRRQSSVPRCSGQCCFSCAVPRPTAHTPAGPGATPPGFSFSACMSHRAWPRNGPRPSMAAAGSTCRAVVTLSSAATSSPGSSASPTVPSPAAPSMAPSSPLWPETFLCVWGMGEGDLSICKCGVQACCNLPMQAFSAFFYTVDFLHTAMNLPVATLTQLDTAVRTLCNQTWAEVSSCTRTCWVQNPQGPNVGGHSGWTAVGLPQGLF